MSSGMPDIIKGSCYCRGIQYEVSSGPIEWNQCHCSMCRKLIGADHCTSIAVPESKLKLKSKNTMRTFRSSDVAVRNFCSNCGASVFMNYNMEKDTIWISAGTLDSEVPIVRPSQVYRNDRAYWLKTMSNAHI